MTDDWDRRIFDKELRAILDAKLPVSASKINSLQGLALGHPKHHNYIVQRIVTFIETAPPDYRLAGLYVIDAISRAAHKQVRKAAEANVNKPLDVENYLRRFAVVFREGALAGCFESCSGKDKEKVKRTLDIWEHGGVYTKEVIEHIKKSFMKPADAGNGNDQNKPPAAKIDAVDTSKVSTPAVDTASLLATLSSLSGSNLGNLVSSATTAPKPVRNDPTQPIFGDDDEDRPNSSSTTGTGLPPALAQLLGGLVSSPSAAAATNTQAQPPVSAEPMVQSPSGFQARPAMPPAPPPSSAATAMPAPPRGQGHWHPLPPPPGLMPTPPSPSDSHVDHQRPPARRIPQGPSINVNNKNKTSRWSDDHERAPAPPRSGRQQWREPSPPPKGPPKRAALPGPVPDLTLPPGTIRVLTRTLFVAPIHDSMSREDVASVFGKYGELNSLIISRKIKNKGNAFVKFVTRASIEAAKSDADRIRIHGQSLKINWAYGFGPKRMFNYDIGESIIPLDELTEDEKQSLTTAPIGGFQGQPVRAQMTIEEPEVEYRPEWKKEELAKQKAATTATGGQKQQQQHRGPPMDDHPGGRKRRRFADEQPRQDNMDWMMGDNRSAAAPPPPFPPPNGAPFPGFPVPPPFFMNGMPFPPPPPPQAQANMVPRPPQQQQMMGTPPPLPPQFGFNGPSPAGNFIPPASGNQQQSDADS